MCNKMCTPFSMNTQQTYPKYRKCNQQLFCIIDVVTFRKEIEWNVVCRCEITSFQLSVTQFHFQIEFHAVCRTILTYKQKLNVINCWTKMNKRQNCVESLWEMQHLIICNKFATVLYQNHWKITKRAWKCERDFYEKKKNESIWCTLHISWKHKRMRALLAWSKSSKMKCTKLRYRWFHHRKFGAAHWIIWLLPSFKS